MVRGRLAKGDASVQVIITGEGGVRGMWCLEGGGAGTTPSLILTLTLALALTLTITTPTLILSENRTGVHTKGMRGGNL